MSVSAHTHQTAIQLVESALGALGLDPVAQRDGDPGSWTIRGQHVEVYITVRPPTRPDVPPFIGVMAPLGTLPATGGERLCRELLSRNSRGFHGAAFALLDDTIVILAERPAERLSTDDVRDLIAHVGSSADHHAESLGLAR